MVLLTCALYFGPFGPGLRIGEASNPGPGLLDNPDADPFHDLEMHLAEVAAELPDAAWVEPPMPGVDPVVSVDTPDFESALQFRGARPGFVFKLGERGLGYCRDSAPAVDDGLTAGGTLRTRDGQLVVPLCLDELLFQECSDLLPDGSHRCRRPRKRPRARRRGPRRGRHAPASSSVAAPHGASVGDGSFRKLGLWAFDTLNGNVDTTALAYMDRAAADACVFQELRLRPQACEQAERTAARSGWSLSVEAAVDTAAGSTSAGVGVAVRSHLGLAMPAAPLHFDELRSRVQVRWMGAVCRGGLHLVSVYLWCTEGLSQRNLDLLQCLAGVLSRIRGPWLVAGDFNMTPDMLRASGWLTLVKGVVHAPEVATCKSRVIDFFVSSRSLSPAVVAVSVVSDAGTSPHVPVRLFLRAAPRSLKMRCLVAPQKLAAHLPAGCLPEPTSYDDVVDVRLSPCATAENLSRSTCLWFDRVENELADVCMLDGAARQRACGRSAGPRFAWKPALGPVGSSSPRVSRLTMAWRVCSVWLRDLLQGFGAHGPRATEFSHAAARARHRLLHTSWSDLGDHNDDAVREFSCFAGGITAQMLTDRICITSLLHTARQAAHRGCEADQRRAIASWKSWLCEGPSDGLGRQHRMSRTAAGWVPSIVSCPAGDGGSEHSGPEPIGILGEEESEEDDIAAFECAGQFLEVPLDGQQAVDVEAAKWAAEWQVGQDAPMPVWPDALGEPLPQLCIDAAVRECLKFPSATGLGWDRLHPRALARCSRAALAALLRIFMLAEVLGRWPETIGVIIIALLPKPDGGRRPIGLFPSLVRLWMRLRLPVAQAWQSSHERPYFYAGPAKGAAVAAWKQAAHAELGASVGMEYAIALLDLVKAFERVPHDWLVRQAKRYGYNLYLLRLSLASYCLARTVRIGSAYAAAVIAVRGITAGAVHATIELRVLLIECLDEAFSISHCVRLTVYVDDIAAEAAAPEKLLLRELRAVLLFLAQRLAAMRLTLSDTKNVCCASLLRIGLELVRTLPLLRLRYRHRVTSLGSGLGAGRRRNALVVATRLAKFVCRRGRFRRLRRVGVRTDRLMRTGGTAALQFGQATTGVSNAALLRQRRAVAAATVTSMGGGDLDITLMLADGGPRGRADPAFAAHTEPIGHWAMAVWEAWMPRRGLTRLASAAARRLSESRRPWSVVYGPAAAFVASAQRLGWVVHDACEVSMDNGQPLHFGLDSPCFVKRLVDESVRRWRWRRVEARLESLAAGGSGAGAIMQPIFRLLDPRRSGQEDWGAPQRSALRSALANRQWPQARLFAAGLADTPHCRLCLAAATHGAARAAVVLDPSEVPHGTLAHRIWTCAWMSPLRDQLAPRAFVQEAHACLAAGTLDTAMWLRGLVPCPVSAVPSPPAEATFVWVLRPPDDAFSGIVYTDGSLLDGPAYCGGLCCRLGWAFVVLDSAGAIIAAARGVPPPWVSTIHGAELWALQMAVLHGLPGSAYRTDCLAVVDVHAQGRQAATSAARYYARIWNVIFTALDDAETVDLAWMPAHTKVHDVGRLFLSNGELLTEADRRANAEADRLAKLSAAETRVPPLVRGRLDSDYNRAQQLAVWIGQVTAAASRSLLPCGGVGRDSQPAARVPRGARPPQPSAPVLQRDPSRGGHLLQHCGHRWRCEVCRVASAKWATLAPEVCPGPATGRWREAAAADVAARGGGRQHRLRTLGDIVWCCACGSYASSRGRGLAIRCRGRPSGASARRRRSLLLEGRHPVSGEYIDGEVAAGSCWHHESDEGHRAAIEAGATRWAALLGRVRAREAAARATLR